MNQQRSGCGLWRARKGAYGIQTSLEIDVFCLRGERWGERSTRADARTEQECSRFFSLLRGVRYLLPCRREEPVSRLYIGLVLFVIQRCVALITRPAFWLRLAGGTRIHLLLRVVQDCSRYLLRRPCDVNVLADEENTRSGNEELDQLCILFG